MAAIQITGTARGVFLSQDAADGTTLAPDPLPVFKTNSGFAQQDTELDAVIVLGSGEVTAEARNPSCDPGLITWSLEAQSGPGITLDVAQGPKASFCPGQPGNYILTVSLTPPGGTDPLVVRFAVVQIQSNGPESFQSGQNFLLTGLAAAPVYGMSLAASYTLSSGPPNAALGAKCIEIGNVGNLTADTFAVNYNGIGSARELPGGSLPLLDRHDCGGDIFRSRNSATPGCPSDSGLVVLVTSSDDPDLQYPRTYPGTEQPAGTPQGGNAFTEYIVARSKSFPHTLKAVFQSEWFASPCESQRAHLAPSTAVPAGTKIAAGPDTFQAEWSFDPPANPTEPPIPCNVPRPADPMAMDFAFGQTVCAALTRGSRIVAGNLLGEPLITDRAVPMQVTETLWGAPVQDDLIHIRYAHRGTRHRYLRRLSRSWDRVRFDTRVPAVAVLTNVPTGTLTPGDPVVVSSSLADLRSIDACIEHEERLSKGPQEIGQLIGAATTARDSILLGYLYEHVWRHEALKDPSAADRLFQLFIGNPAVPSAAYSQIVQNAGVTFNLLSAELQAKVVGRLHRYTQSSDLAVIAAGFRGFAQLAGIGYKLPQVPSSDMSLSATYKGALERGLPRDALLERQLGIDDG